MRVRVLSRVSNVFFFCVLRILDCMYDNVSCWFLHHIVRVTTTASQPRPVLRLLPASLKCGYYCRMMM
jgi:hypothetical protein